MRVPTRISVVYGSDGQALCELNRNTGDRNTGELVPISLFDRLLGGGLVIPDEVVNAWLEKPGSCSPVVLLISGPAGTGKTTLAMELVYRLAQFGLPDPTTRGVDHPVHSLYISAESPGGLLVGSKVSDLGWDRQWFGDASGAATTPLPGRGWVLVMGRDAPTFRNAKTPNAVYDSLLNQCEYNQLARLVRGRPGVVVIDSLNVLPPQDRPDFFRKLVQQITGPFLLVVILDATPDQGADAFWEFAADSVIRLSQSEREDPRVGTYLLGEFRMGKGRWQKHALGSHQIKVFGKIEKDSVHSIPPGRNYHGTGHLPPFRHDGGIQLYQSLHRHLSEGQRVKPTAATTPTPIQFDPSP